MSAARRLSSILERADVEPRAGIGGDPEISGANLDSRIVERGDLFFAVPGFRTDGARFVPDALQRGAVAIVASGPRPRDLDASVGWVEVEDVRRAAGRLSRETYGRPDEALTLVGVTGTNGKTTVSWLIESIAAAAGRQVGRIGTVGVSLAGTGRPSAHTTPEAPELYRLLAEMRDAGIDLVALEVSSHALALARVEAARFRVAAFLNLGQDHQDFHADERAYLAAKARIFDGLTATDHAVLPADSIHRTALARRVSGPVLTFGRSPGSNVRLTDEHSSLEGSSASLTTSSGAIPVRTHLLGRVNLDNIAAAAACAIALELPPDAITTGVLAVDRVPGRLERIDHGQPFAVIVDYAHTTDALEHVLCWLRSVTRRRLIVVFGCGGERDRDKRFGMGRVAGEAADRIFLTSDNPRSEKPESILEEIAAGVASVDGALERSERLVDREQAIGAALGEAGDGDVVIIAGKGHETVQVIGSEIRALDDREVAARTLHGLGFSEGRHAQA